MEQKTKPQLDPNQISAWSISDFLKKLSSEDPIPGGGSVAALAGSLGAALIVMYSKLGAVRKGVSGDDQEVLQKISIEATSYLQQLTRLITEDSVAYNAVVEAYKMSKTTEEETKARQEAIQKAFRSAVEIPMQTLNVCIECLYLVSEVASFGNPSAFSDLKVGEYVCKAAAKGAIENIEINLPSIKDPQFLKVAETNLNKLKNSLEEVSKQKVVKPI